MKIGGSIEDSDEENDNNNPFDISEKEILIKANQLNEL